MNQMEGGRKKVRKRGINAGMKEESEERRSE